MAKTFLEKRYREDLELEDAVHIALLTLKETIEGEMNGETVEIGKYVDLPLMARSNDIIQVSLDHRRNVYLVLRVSRVQWDHDSESFHPKR